MMEVSTEEDMKLWRPCEEYYQKNNEIGENIKECMSAILKFITKLVEIQRHCGHVRTM